MMGGIIVGTLLTLLFPPGALRGRFRIKAPAVAKTESAPERAEALPVPAQRYRSRHRVRWADRLMS